jgi:NTE family protein
LLDLADIPLFADLPAAASGPLRRASELRGCERGSVICRKGDHGRFLFIVAHGGVGIHLAGSADVDPPDALLGPGDVFGEMSLLLGSPISATAVAAQDAAVYQLPKADFLALVQGHPAFRRTLLRLIVRRVREKAEAPLDRSRPACLWLLMPSPRTRIRRLFVSALARALRHYVPSSRVIESSPDRSPDPRDPVVDAGMCLTPSLREGQLGAEVAPGRLTDHVARWRRAKETDAVLIVVLGASEVPALRPLLERGDALLVEEDPLEESHLLTLISGGGLADLHLFRLPDDAAAGRFRENGSWSFRVTAEELERWDLDRDDEPSRRSGRDVIDWIARWVAHREIGIALGPGAASGFSHLGALQVLEEAGIVPDYLVGSSIGGAAALLYARHGRASAAIEAAREAVGRTDRIVDVSWLPRSSLLAGRKHSAAAAALYGELQIAELVMPAAAVAADLVRGERFIMDRGSAATAALATTAIPGVFPPVRSGGRLLVDGALLSQVPADLLRRRRCGFRLAVTPVSSPHPGDSRQYHQELMNRFHALFGFRSVVATSWQLLASQQREPETRAADVVVEPHVPQSFSFDFDSCDQMVEAGRRAAADKLDAIRASARSLLKRPI